MPELSWTNIGGRTNVFPPIDTDNREVYSHCERGGRQQTFTKEYLSVLYSNLLALKCKPCMRFANP